MRTMTANNLREALAGESQAFVKYLAFAAQAEKEGMPNIARLFRAIAYAEQVHATNHLKELGGIGDTVTNLGTAIDGETFEVDEMYASYVLVAEAQEERGARRSMNFALEAEKIHAEMYGSAREAAQAGHDLEMGEVHICPVCGFTHIGEPPERCPICKIPRNRFETF